MLPSLTQIRNQQRSKSHISSLQQITRVPSHSPFCGDVLCRLNRPSSHFICTDDTKDCPTEPCLSKDRTQITKSFKSLISPSAHLYPNVFWPPSQLSPSADGNTLVARQCISTVATPKDVMQTRDRIQTDTAMFFGRGSNVLHIAGTITISISFFT